jgi:hypothetical protein
VEIIINNPDEVLLDVETGNVVAVGNRISIPRHRLLVVYSQAK